MIINNMLLYQDIGNCRTILGNILFPNIMTYDFNVENAYGQ